MEWVIANLPWMIPAAVAIAALTPTKKDDKIVLTIKRVYDFLSKGKVKPPE